MNNESMTVHVTATTGASFELKLPVSGTVDELRWQVARKLQLPRDRLTIIHRESVLKSGSLADHGIVDGSRVTLLPNIEAGFTTSNQGTEQSVVQAIESLSDQQIDDFLSGRDPLTLALRVEDHMMFIQLQLEQQSKEKRKSRHRRHQQSTSSTSSTSSSAQPGPSGLSSKSSKSRKQKSNSHTIHIPAATAAAQLGLTQLIAAAAQGEGASLAALAPFIGLTPNPTTKSEPKISPNENTEQKERPSSSKTTAENKISESKKSDTRPSIYSGTFSGSLHPSIQDIQGNPRRDPRTILHILRDLLSATNQQQFIPQILRGGNGVMVGAPGSRIARQSKSIPIKTTSSNTKISKHRVQKSSSGTLRRMKAETNKVTPQYVQWLNRVKTENDVTRSKMADLQEALRKRKERRKNRHSDQFRNSIKEDGDNQQVHSIPTVQHNIAISQLQQQPMQTDDDNQLGTMSDCVTV